MVGRPRQAGPWGLLVRQASLRGRQRQAGLLSSAWTKERVSGQSRLHRVALSWKTTMKGRGGVHVCVCVCMCMCVCVCLCVLELVGKPPPGQPVPSAGLQACAATPGLFHGCWESELRASCLPRKHSKCTYRGGTLVNTAIILTQ